MLGSNDVELYGKNLGAIRGILHESKKNIDIEFDDLLILADESAITPKSKKKYSDAIPEIEEYCKKNFNHNLTVNFDRFELKDPTNYAEIYPLLLTFIKNLKPNKKNQYFISLTSGTPTMTACWLLLAKSGLIDARLLQTSRHQGLKEIDLNINDFPLVRKLDEAKIKLKQYREEIDYLKNLELNIEIPEIIGNSPQIIEIKKQIEHLAKYDIPIMILGETGTGKELVARAIHDNSSRSNKKFMTINCGAINEGTVESELFGHIKGSFTGATSDTKGAFGEVGNGTLFLDEIGDLPLFMQVKLLRVINEKTYTRHGDIGNLLKSNARIVAATNKNLIILMKEGKFREDLFYRLTDDTITLPPLNSRGNDIIEIANNLLEQMNSKHEKRLKFSNSAITKLENYNWVGNIRELNQVIRRAFIYSEKIIDEKDIRFNSSRVDNIDTNNITIPENGLNFEKDVEMNYYIAALIKTNGNITEAAKLLDIESPAFTARLKKKKIDYKEYKKS